MSLNESGELIELIELSKLGEDASKDGAVCDASLAS
jgi:hypothetical protein